MDGSRLGSAQDFIRALKSSPDPPRPDGPPKIQLAREAWDNCVFYLPNKGEVIVDWLLTRLLKDKGKERSSNPILDIRYWDLLADIILGASDTKRGGNTHSLKTWILPLLNRSPIAPVVTTFFLLTASSENHTGDTLTQVAFNCLCVLWPLAVPKFTPEALLECFGALLASRAATGPSNGAERLERLVTSSYREAFNVTSNKKKLYSVFLQAHFQHWLQCVYHDNVSQIFFAEIYSAGADILFHVDILRNLDDHKCDPVLQQTLVSLMPNLSTIILFGLPRLFGSFVDTLKRHRNTLFGQSSNATYGKSTSQVHSAAMVFFVMCDELLAMSTGEGNNIGAWTARIALLNIVNDESLYDTRDERATNILKRNGSLAVDVLSSAWKKENPQRADAALDVLAVLTKIDYDLMSAALASVHSKLVLIPEESNSALPYLIILLDYHSKTRTIYSLLLHWLDAFSVEYFLATGEEVCRIYQLAASGPLLSFSYLDRLANAIRGFLTPGQVDEVVNTLLYRWQSAFDAFVEQDKLHRADDGMGPRKKRKKDVGADAMNEYRVDPAWKAVTFSLLSRAVVLVLGALPMHSLLDEARQEVRNKIGERYTSVVPRALKGVSKSLNADDRREIWAWQIVAAASLRVHCGLTSTRRSKQELQLESSFVSKIHVAITSEGTLPELVVEMARTMLMESISGIAETEIAIDDILIYIENHLTNSDVAWSGKMHALAVEAAHAEAALAIFHLLCTTWTPLLDSRATTEQLARLAKLMFKIDIKIPIRSVPNHLSAETILVNALHNAAFWEFHRLRDALVFELEQQTADLQNTDLGSILTDAKTRSSKKLAPSASYEFLLHAPSEFLPRNLRADLLRRALVADVMTSRSQVKEPSDHPLLVIREFLWRTFAHIGSIDYATKKEFFAHLMDPPSTYTTDNKELMNITLDLISMHVDHFLKAAEKGDEADAFSAVDSFIALINVPVEQRLPGDVVRERALLRGIDILTTNHQITQYSDSFKASLSLLHERMSAVYGAKMMEISQGEHGKASNTIITEVDLLQVWSRTLSLGRWLGVEVDAVPQFGQSLVSQFIKASRARLEADVCLHVLTIVLEELRLSSEQEYQGHLEYVVVAYIVFASRCPPTELLPLNVRLCRSFRTLTTSDFAYILQYILAALSSVDTIPADSVTSLVSLTSMLIHDAPEGTMKVAQGCVSQCLDLFADHDRFLTVPTLRHEVLNFMSRQFSNRPAAIRKSDLSSVWSILGELLAPSAEHEETTDASAFHDIVAILSVLVRSRRDLVLDALPHLGMVLRRLTSALRGPRPQLGAKQTKLVQATLPRWVHARQPLTAEESRALARLLTTLTAKTSVRSHAQAQAVESQKLESLARPFSKHAAFVLVAYIGAVNDPLCHLSTQVRQELLPGLFALCDMLGEYNRDAMMVQALDAGGKVIMKALWKEYEKQRYTGKG